MLLVLTGIASLSTHNLCICGGTRKRLIWIFALSRDMVAETMTIWPPGIDIHSFCACGPLKQAMLQENLHYTIIMHIEEKDPYAVS